MHVVSYLIGAMFFVASVALLVFAGLAQAYSKPVVSEPVVSDAPDIFCPTIGCRYMAGHQGCCGECDVCAQFGSHDAPVLNTPPMEYVGKHAKCAVNSMQSYYKGKHRQTISRREAYYLTGK